MRITFVFSMTPRNIQSIAIIGCGNLGTAIAEGLLREGFPAGSLTVTRSRPEHLSHLAERGVQVSANNRNAVRGREIVLICVKPFRVHEILMEIRDVLDTSSQLLVSTVANTSLAALEEALGKPMPMFRAMPNTASAVQESLTCLCSRHTTNAQDEAIASMFRSIGTAILIREDLMEAATVIGASGIAFVMRFMRAMIQGGIQIGFDSPTATRIVAQTMKGAAELILSNGQHPEAEIDKVTTPKGCTIAGLNEMEHQGFSSALIRGIVASYEKLETM